MVAQILYVCFLVGWQISLHLKAAHSLQHCHLGLELVTLLLPPRQKGHPSGCLQGARQASSLPTRFLCLGLAMCVCLGGMLWGLCISGFSPHPNLAGLCSRVMENSRGLLKQGRFSSAKRLPSQGNVAISQPSKGPCGHVLYLSHLTSSYQSKHDMTVLCTPVGNTRIKSRLLETAAQKGDLKELVCPPPDDFISDSPHENARYHGKNPSFFPCAVCLFVSM